jgi:hypothetical protein
LTGGDGLHGMSAPNGLHAGFRKAEILHIALLDQLLDRACHVFDRHVEVDPMLVEQVDRLCSQSLQRTPNGNANLFGAAVKSGCPRPGVASQVEAELGCDDDFVAIRSERFANKLRAAYS